MDAVLYTEINVFSISVLLIIAYKSAAIKHSTQGKLFLYSIWFVIAANTFDFFWKIGSVGVLPFSPVILTAINFGYFVCFGISAYFWFLYSESKGRSDLIGNTKAEELYALPIVLLVILLIVSMFNGCLFYFDAQGVYHRGPLFYAQQILAYGYIGVACLKNLFKSFKKENYAYREELFTAVYFVVPPAIALVAQVFFQDAPIFVLGITASFLMAYINAVNMLISIDPLTGVHNRRTLLLQIDDRIHALRSSERLVLLFMDIDGFKQVNDVHGHDEGDRVLKVVAAALGEMAVRQGGMCARYGGDEFVFVRRLEGHENVELIKADIQNLIWHKAKAYELPCDVDVSIGHAEYPVHAKNTHDLLQAADMSMYEAKKRNKSARTSELFE